jgi:hypothetical protein
MARRPVLADKTHWIAFFGDAEEDRLPVESLVCRRVRVPRRRPSPRVAGDHDVRGRFFLTRTNRSRRRRDFSSVPHVSIAH